MLKRGRVVECSGASPCGIVMVVLGLIYSVRHFGDVCRVNAEGLSSFDKTKDRVEKHRL